MNYRQKLYQNPEYRETIQALINLSVTFGPELPFTPYISNRYGESKSPRVIWYGAATNGWKGETFKNVDELVADNLKWCENDLNRHLNGTPFWRVQRKCLEQMGGSLEHSTWSNVFKIGADTNNGMPRAELARKQIPGCMKAMELEFKTLDPEIVVFHTGQLVDSYWSKLLPEWNKWKKFETSAGKAISAIYTQEGSPPLIWLSRNRSHSDNDLIKALNKARAAIKL